MVGEDSLPPFETLLGHPERMPSGILDLARIPVLISFHG